MWQFEPLVASIERRDEGHAQEQALDRVFPRKDSVLSAVERGLGRRSLRVVRAPGMPDAHSLEYRRPVAEPMDVSYVSGVFVPEDELSALAESADAIVQLTRRHRAAAARGALEDRYAVDLTTDIGIPVLAQVLDVSGCRVVGVIDETRR